MLSVIIGDDIEDMGRASEQEYRSDQLLFAPYVRRRWTPYGFSPVERALVPVQMGLSRQQFQLDLFTEGTIPGMFVIPGEQFSTPQQTRTLQDLLNNLASDVAWKHRIIVLPSGSKS